MVFSLWYQFIFSDRLCGISMVVSNSLPIKFCMILKILMVTCCRFSTSELSIDVENHGGIIIFHRKFLCLLCEGTSKSEFRLSTLREIELGPRQVEGLARFQEHMVRYGWYMCFPWYGTVGYMCFPNFLWLNHVKSRKMPAKKYPVSIYASRYSSIKYLNML